jgi:hypothetical protein
MVGAVALHPMMENKYNNERSKATALKDHIYSTLPESYVEKLDSAPTNSPASAYYTVYRTVVAQRDVMAPTLDQEYAKLRGRRTVMSAEDWCRDMLALYRKGVQFKAPFTNYINLWLVSDLTHCWPNVSRTVW